MSSRTGDALTRHFAEQLAMLQRTAGLPLSRLAIACSGGLDSMVLLHLAVAWRTAQLAQSAQPTQENDNKNEHDDVQLFVFHIHHGLSPNADSWRDHVQQYAEQAGATFDSKNVVVQPTGGHSLEEVAREQRYAALGELCSEHQVAMLLTAHHLDDQAETVLLQMLRGSGVAGLAAMPRMQPAAELFKQKKHTEQQGAWLGRPLLDSSRDSLQQYCNVHNVLHIEDESNHDLRYARNAVRHRGLAVLKEISPGCEKRLGRVAQHMQYTQECLTELADIDLNACRDGEQLKLSALRQLSAHRRFNLLRHWLGLHHLRMPSSAWLHELDDQLQRIGADAQCCVRHPDGEIRSYRDRVTIVARTDKAPSPEPLLLRWNGETILPLPDFGGALHIVQAAGGIDAEWLKKQQLIVRIGPNSTTLKPAPNRSARSLKHHYQERGVAAWQRQRLPLVFASDRPDMLLFAAGVGMDCRPPTDDSGRTVAFEWHPSAG